MASVTEIDPKLADSFLKQARTGLSDNTRDYQGSTRVPFVLTCEEWLRYIPTDNEALDYNFVIDPVTGDTVEASDLKPLQGVGKYILMFVNPSEANWEFPTRRSLQKCKGGEVMHAWYNKKRKTYFDELRLNFTFQTGNIMPMLQSETAVALRPGHDNFFEFMGLLDTHSVLANGQPNLQYIIYNSPLYPYLVLQGWFRPEGPTLVDSSSDPYQKQYTIGFSVHNTFPHIADPAALRSVFQNTSAAPQLKQLSPIS